MHNFVTFSKELQTEEVNMRRIHFKFTSVGTCLFRDALSDNMEAFCCFSNANLLVLSLFLHLMQGHLVLTAGKGGEAAGGGIDGMKVRREMKCKTKRKRANCTQLKTGL